MDTSTASHTLKGVVPAVCDAETGQENLTVPWRGSSDTGPTDSEREFPIRNIRTVMAELCTAIRCALDGERGIAEESLRRAGEILEKFDPTENAKTEPTHGQLAPWQIRKVTNYVEATLDRTIRNDDLAALVRLTPSHFGRAFRNSVGEPPHEYVIRRRIERAQGLMLSTPASLSEIALNCGLADQSHLTRLFRRMVGESPMAWRRARIST